MRDAIFYNDVSHWLGTSLDSVLLYRKRKGIGFRYWFLANILVITKLMECFLACELNSFSSSRPNDSYMRQQIISPLVHDMDCHIFDAKPFLTQYWHIVNQSNPLGITFDEVWLKKIPIHGNEFVSNICKMTPTLFRFTCWVLVCSDIVIYHLNVQTTMPQHDPHLSARKINYIHYKVWDEIIHPFLTYKSTVIAVWEWTNNFISPPVIDVIVHPCWD